MKIEWIRLVNYRNHPLFEMSPDPHANVLVGANASGKTNVLEAVHFALSGQMFRAGQERDMIAYEQQEAAIFLRVRDGFRMSEISVRLSQKGAKQIRINNENAGPVREWAPRYPVVLFTPDDLRIAKDSPTYRRRYLDQILFSVDVVYRKAYGAYQRTLAQRNALLKQGKSRFFMEQLSTLDAQLIQSGSVLLLKRQALIESVDALGQELHRTVSVGKEQFGVVYKPDIPLAERSRSAVSQAYVQALREALPKDMQTRTTSRGPHRDDMELVADDRPLRLFGSQGQQRSFVLTLKLVETKLRTRFGETEPVLLLDDVLSELDESRQNAMREANGDLQVLFTATSAPQDWIGNAAVHKMDAIQSA